MSEEFNNKEGLFEKFKNLKTSRAALISAGLLAVSIIIITAVAIASNRAKKDAVDTPNTRAPETEQNNVITPPADTTPSTPETDAPTVKPNNNASQVQDKLPSFVLPVSGNLVSSHDPSMQVYSNTMNDYRVHLGVDIVTEEGAPVYAAADGKIDMIWEDVRMGYCIAIKHSGDCYTIYKNLSETLPDGIAEGVSVRSGQLIASIGESAMVEVAEEPHLHFEMTVADLAVDPLEYFDEKSLQTLAIDASHGE